MADSTNWCSIEYIRSVGGGKLITESVSRYIHTYLLDSARLRLSTLSEPRKSDSRVRHGLATVPGLSVRPPLPFPFAGLPACQPARLLVGLSVSLRIAHCAAHCVRNFLFRVRFSSVFRCRQSVRKRRAVWSFFDCLRGLLSVLQLVRFGSILLTRSVRLGRPLAYRTNSFLAGGKLCAPWKWVSLYA